MQTHFTPAQLADPDIAVANDILRACVHCGFCTATCPTFLLLGDELDSPRGRIYLIKDMLENDRPAAPALVTHIDRCLSCLSCMTTCPSGVHYMHLVDHARARIEETYTRPVDDRLLRRLLAWLLPSATGFRLALLAASLARPLRGVLLRLPWPAAWARPVDRLAAMLAMAPRRLPPPSPCDRPQLFPAIGRRRKRVALLTGCAQKVLDPAINEATIRLLTRHGCEVVIADGVSCCGALMHHMGRTADSHARAATAIDAWLREADGAGLDAIVVNTSGCGTTVKDYGFMFRTDPAMATRARRVSELTRDIAELMTDLMAEPGLAAGATVPPPLRVTYHSACSMQHGQRIRTEPKALLQAAGFTVADVPEGHICCGSAGTYNLLQPRLAGALQARKAANIAATAPQVIAAGNIGCMAQIAAATDVPVVHMVQLLDWATGGPKPEALAALPG